MISELERWKEFLDGMGRKFELLEILISNEIALTFDAGQYNDRAVTIYFTKEGDWLR